MDIGTGGSGIPLDLPAVTLRREVIFPGVTAGVFFRRSAFAAGSGRKLRRGRSVAVFWRPARGEEPLSVGVLAKVVDIESYGDRVQRVVLSGRARIRVLGGRVAEGVKVQVISASSAEDISDGLYSRFRSSLAGWIFMNRSVPDDLLSMIGFIKRPGAVCDLFAHYFIKSYRRKLEVLQLIDERERTKNVLRYIESDMSRLRSSWSVPPAAGPLTTLWH